MNDAEKKLKLIRRGDQVFARRDSGEDVPVKVVWARPVSGRGREISLLCEEKKELLLAGGLEAFDPESRQIAQEELDRRYLIPRITRVVGTESNFGSRYWFAETDRGAVTFLIKDPNTDVTWLSEDRLVIRDSLGNRYEIESLSALDEVSRGHIDRVL
jgi:hypothetical protein